MARNILQNLPARLIPVSPRDLIAIAVSNHMTRPQYRSRDESGIIPFELMENKTVESTNFSELSHRLSYFHHFPQPVYCDVVTQLHPEILTRCFAVSGDGFTISF